jgi:hypothetical protein
VYRSKQLLTYDEAAGAVVVQRQLGGAVTRDIVAAIAHTAGILVASGSIDFSAHLDRLDGVPGKVVGGAGRYVGLPEIRRARVRTQRDPGALIGFVVKRKMPRIGGLSDADRMHCDERHAKRQDE